MMVQLVKDWGPVFVLVAAVFSAWYTLQDTAEDASEAVKQLSTSVSETRSIHKEDMRKSSEADAKIQGYIDVTERRRAEEQGNLRALCKVRKLDRAYCETRGFEFGSE